MRGGFVCRKHGGKAPQTLRKAAERQIFRQIADYDVTPITDPYTALADLAGRILAVSRLFEDEFERLDQLRYEGNLRGEQVRAEVELYERALDRSAKVLGEMARLDLDARIAKLHAVIDETTADVITAALMAALVAARCTPEQAEAARVELASQLRASSPALSRADSAAADQRAAGVLAGPPNRVGRARAPHNS